MAEKLNSMVLMVCRHLKNFHISENNKPHLRVEGTFAVTDGNLALDGDFAASDWIAITDTRRNNGIYLLSEVPPLEAPLEPYATPHFRLSNATDSINPLDGIKSLVGVVWLQIMPAGFIETCTEIMSWVNDPANAPSAVISESEGVLGFDQWEVTRAAGPDGKPISWQEIFEEKLTPHRRMFTGMRI